MNGRKVLEFGKEFGFFDRVNIYEDSNKTEVVYTAKNFELKRAQRLFRGIGYNIEEVKIEPIRDRELMIYIVLKEVRE